MIGQGKRTEKLEGLVVGIEKSQAVMGAVLTTLEKQPGLIVPEAMITAPTETKLVEAKELFEKLQRARDALTDIKDDIKAGNKFGSLDVTVISDILKETEVTR